MGFRLPSCKILIGDICFDVDFLLRPLLEWLAGQESSFLQIVSIAFEAVKNHRKNISLQNLLLIFCVWLARLQNSCTCWLFWGRTKYFIQVSGSCCIAIAWDTLLCWFSGLVFTRWRSQSVLLCLVHLWLPECSPMSDTIPHVGAHFCILCRSVNSGR